MNQLGWLAPGILLLSLVAGAAVTVIAWTKGLDRAIATRLGCAVRGRSRAYKAASGLLLAVALVIAAASFAAAWAPSTLDAYLEALEHWLLACSVLLLAGAGMIRWYSERRNHLAQAARYDDLLRAFRRAEDLLLRHGPLDHALRQHLCELGEMALDESEAWLKAHRDRPLEPMAGG